MQEINAWLFSERDFTKGAELYMHCGANSFFKSLLKAGPTPYNVKKLGEELEKLKVEDCELKVTSTPARPAPATHNSQPTPKISETQKAANHAEFISLCQRRDDIVRQLDRNMAALSFSNNKTVLFETAKQILRLHQQKQEIWTKIDYYNIHQQFEPVAEVVQKSREAKMQLIYQSLSKARTRLANPEYKDKARTQKLIDRKLRELEILKGGTE